jgi:hypothetical protein
LSNWHAARNEVSMLATAGGEAVVPAVHWGWLSNTTVVAFVRPPARRDHPSLEREVFSRSDSLSRREGWEEATTDWTSTMVMKLKTKNDGKHQKFPPSWRAKYQSGFTTLPPVLPWEQPTVVLLLERAWISWLLAQGGHKDLRGSGHQSVIPYVHKRMELYCSTLALLM